MAEMIPESVPSGRPKSERRVFDILQYLPDDYIVYYEPFIAQRYPDFVVICPDLGLMVIEVKGWKIDNIKRADLNQVVLSFGGSPEAHQHPLVQARNYKFRRVPRFLVRDELSDTGEIAMRKEWFPALEWGTWRVRNDVSMRRTGDGKTNIGHGLDGQ